jgi:NAD(P)-dependent dehydrogenase (short-subunit alcohol dehydrogenase family)
MKAQDKVWYITGASKGLGLSLVKQLLAAGNRVAATSRSLEDLKSAVGGHENFLPLAVDLTSEASVKDSVDSVIKQWSRLDVVVNNAGYGLMGSLEELSDKESRDNFEVNVFGTLNVIRNVMPVLRRQRFGHIFNIASIGGFFGGFPGFGIYCATKFAVVGLSESLAAEAKAFGVNVTVVQPGYFRTNFLTSGSLAVPANEIAEYADVRESQKAHQTGIDGNQPGDPEKAAAVMIEMAQQEAPALHLFLGRDAYDMADKKILLVQNDMDKWESLATSTAFEETVNK